VSAELKHAIALTCFTCMHSQVVRSSADMLYLHAFAADMLYLHAFAGGTNLITSGWWGMARKINYTGDWLFGLSWSLFTGVLEPSDPRSRGRKALIVEP
jgi:hypothetical protein